MTNRNIILILWATVLCFVIVGCSRKSQVPTGKPAENIRKLALAFVQFSATNRGRGPADKQSLKKFLVQRNGLNEQEADALFISPRDNQPYVVLWGLKPEVSGPMSSESSELKIIIYEKIGADDTRYVADGRLSILQMTQEEFSSAVPDHEN